MSEAFSSLHVPILVPDVVRLFSPLDGKLIVDGTVGLGGHSDALLRSGETLRIIGIDRDRDALALAGRRLVRYGERVQLLRGNFRDLDQLLNDLGVNAVDGVLLDVGVSSLQLDTASRGFSFRQDGRLDMRMNQEADRTAEDWIHEATESEIADVLFRYGEERYARRIARAIVLTRIERRIETTSALADIVRRAVPARYEHGRLHPATRSFQAIRIFINDELEALRVGLQAGFDRLEIGGTMIVISFHSLEDRLVKRFFREKARDCICPPDLPACVCDKQVEAEILTPRPLRAPDEEIEANPRARSARLRAARRLV